MALVTVQMLRERRSRTADRARAGERDRLERLDGRARILLALRLGRRVRRLAAGPQGAND